MTTATGLLVAAMVSSLLTAGAMTALPLPGTALPFMLAVVFGASWLALRGLAAGWREPPLEWHEKALLWFALLVGLVRLAVYGYQYASGALVAAVTWDDHWHFQELASLVNAERFPPRLNFAPEAFFHFYFVSWVPAAAISSLLLTLTGQPMIKLGYGLGALALNVGVAWALIVGVRHLCPPPARLWALLALTVAGAAVDGVLALWHLVAEGRLVHAEWWQLGLLVRNSFSALSSALIWVPHHLTGAAAMLLAVVVATEPVTLAPREGRAPYVVAGLLVCTAAFSSIFAFAGGVIVLLPLAWELARRGDRQRLACLGLACALPALPLAYIYLGADARGGFVLGQPFVEWSKATGKTAMGLAGIAIAFVLMVAEVGWLYALGRRIDGGEAEGARLRSLATAGALVLASTAVVGFSGSNNWALRATIVPVVVLACYAGRGLAGLARSDRAALMRAGAVALALSVVAHLNETAMLLGRAYSAPAYASETAACKAAIMVANRDGMSAVPRVAFSGCRDPYSAYHSERPFIKSELSPVDRELMGRGFGFLWGDAKPVAR